MTQINIKIERQSDREEEEVGTDRRIHLRSIDIYRENQIERRRRQVQIDVHNLDQYKDREIVRWRGGGRGTDRCI